MSVVARYSDVNSQGYVGVPLAHCEGCCETRFSGIDGGNTVEPLFSGDDGDG